MTSQIATLIRTSFHSIVRAGIGSLALDLLCPAWAVYPEKPITLIVPYPPGGMGSTFGNMVSEALSPGLGQRVVVDFKPGANGGEAIRVLQVGQCALGN